MKQTLVFMVLQDKPFKNLGFTEMEVEEDIELNQDFYDLVKRNYINSNPSIPEIISENIRICLDFPKTNAINKWNKIKAEFKDACYRGKFYELQYVTSCPHIEEILNWFEQKFKEK